MDEKYAKFNMYVELEKDKKFDDAEAAEALAARDEILDLPQKEFANEPMLKKALMNIEGLLMACGKLSEDEATFLESGN